MVSVTASPPQYVCVFLCVWVCISPRPLLLADSQAVPIKRAQGRLLWQQLLWCAVLSVCVCVFLPLSSVSAEADGPSSHGAGPSCVLCCRSGSLSGWSVVCTVSSHNRSRKASTLFFVALSVFVLQIFKLFTASPHALSPCSAFLPLLFSELFSPSTVSLAPPSLSVCLHSSSFRMDLVCTHIN